MPVGRLEYQRISDFSSKIDGCFNVGCGDRHVPWHTQAMSGYLLLHQNLVSAEPVLFGPVSGNSEFGAQLCHRILQGLREGNQPVDLPVFTDYVPKQRSMGSGVAEVIDLIQLVGARRSRDPGQPPAIDQIDHRIRSMADKVFVTHKLKIPAMRAGKSWSVVGNYDVHGMCAANWWERICNRVRMAPTRSSFS